MNNYGFDLNVYLLLSLMRENRKNLEKVILDKNIPNKVMKDITESFYYGFYARTDMKKSNDFKEKYGRLSSLNDAYLYYYLNEYYYMMMSFIKHDSSDDYNRYKFIGNHIASKLKEDYVKHFNKTPFNFVRYEIDKKRNEIGHFTSLNGINVSDLSYTFENSLTSLKENNISSSELNDMKNFQYQTLKQLLDNLGISNSFNLISNSIWNGFYDHRFSDIKDLFGRIGKKSLNQKLDSSLLSYRVSMMETIITLLQERKIKNIDLLVLFSKEIGKIAKLKFLDEKKNYPYNYLENYYFGSDQISLFDEDKKRSGYSAK